MPTSKSAKKRVRTNEIRHKRNLGTKSVLKTYLKKCDESIAEKKTEEATSLVRETISKLDKAVAKKIMHRNTASRKKSQLMKQLSKA